MREHRLFGVCGLFIRRRLCVDPPRVSLFFVVNGCDENADWASCPKALRSRPQRRSPKKPAGYFQEEGRELCKRSRFPFYLLPRPGMDPPDQRRRAQVALPLIH